MLPNIGDIVRLYVDEIGSITQTQTATMIDAEVWTIAPFQNAFTVMWRNEPTIIANQLVTRFGAHWLYRSWVYSKSIVDYMILSNNKCYVCSIPAPHIKKINQYICLICNAANSLRLES